MSTITWTKLKCIMLSERNQIQRATDLFWWLTKPHWAWKSLWKWVGLYLILSLVKGMVSLSFFQKNTGGGMPITRHSNLTGWPSGTPQFCSFSRITGAFFTSLAKQEKSHSYLNTKCLGVHASDSLQFWNWAEWAPMHLTSSSEHFSCL